MLWVFCFPRWENGRIVEGKDRRGFFDNESLV